MSERVDPHWKQNYERFYEGDVEAWRRIGAVDKADNIVRLCSPYPHAHVLEIGCGDGAVLARLSEVGFGEALHGVELSSTAAGRARARGIPNLVECRTFDGGALPFPDDAFDLAVLTHVVEHLEHPRALLYEAARVAPRVFVEVPLEDTLRLGPNYTPDAVGHINFYSPKTIRRLLATCGLEVKAQIVTNPSRAAHTHYGGIRGWSRFLAKEAALRLTPRVAPLLYVYHSALICERAAPVS